MRIVNRKRFIFSMAIMLILVVSILSISLANEKIQTADYTISAGETLWSIALENKEAGQDVREYIYNLKKINNINSMIYEGQVIKIIK